MFVWTRRAVELLILIVRHNKRKSVQRKWSQAQRVIEGSINFHRKSNNNKHKERRNQRQQIIPPLTLPTPNNYYHHYCNNNNNNNCSKTIKIFVFITISALFACNNIDIDNGKNEFPLLYFSLSHSLVFYYHCYSLIFCKMAANYLKYFFISKLKLIECLINLLGFYNNISYFI